MTQDRALQGSQLGRRLQPQLVADRPAERVERLQGIGVTAVMGEGPHPQAHRPLAEWMVDGQLQHRRRHLRGPAELEQALRARLGGLRAQLLEARRVRQDRRMVRQPEIGRAKLPTDLGGDAGRDRRPAGGGGRVSTNVCALQQES